MNFKQILTKLEKPAVVILTIGGIAWGLLAIFSYDLVGVISLGNAWLANTIKVLAGISALVIAPTIFKK